MPTGVASGLPAGWEWDYDGTRWFYIFKANGHIQYHFPSEGDEFPDFVGVTEPAPGLEPEGRLESHQQVRRVTGAVAPSERRKMKKKKENGMTATAPRPVGIEWDGDIGGSSEEEQEQEAGGGRTVFEPENLMFLGPQVYADVSPLNEEEEEAAKRTVVGAVVVGDARLGGVSPAETTSAGTPATKRAEPVTEGGKSQPAHIIVSETVEAQVVSMPPAKEEPTSFRGEEAPAVRETNKAEGPAHAHAAPQKTAPGQEMRVAAELALSLPRAQQNAPVAAPVIEATAPPPPHHKATASPPPQASKPAAAEPPVEPRYELPVADSPFNPVGVIAEMPTEDTPRSHIELNPIPVEIMDASVLAPIETAAAAAAATPPLPGVVELPGQSSAAAVVRQMPPPPQQQRSVAPPVMMRMKIKRKPTDPNAAIPSPLSAGSSLCSPAAAVSPPSVASPSPAAPTPPAPAPAPMPPQYKPYAPVSPLLRADMEPVRASPPPMQQQSVTTMAPPSPVANPQLSYAPSVLRPAGRKSMSVSPERRQEAGSQAHAGGIVHNGMPENTAPQNVPVPPGQMLQPGQAPPPGPSQQHVQALRPGQIPAQGQMQHPGPASQQEPNQFPPQSQAQAPGTLPSYLQPPQGQLPQQGQAPPQGPVSTQAQAMQNVSRPPMQHGRPVSLAAAPGQYPPVPIPQPYGQYQRPSPQGGLYPGPSWLAPGQQAPTQQALGHNFATPPQQQQPPPGWMRQSMPPGYHQQPPNGRHSMMGPTAPGLVPLGKQYRPALPPKSPLPNQQPVGQGPHSSSTADSPVVSPVRSRADSQPSNLSLPSPSPMETPQAQPAAPPQPQEQQPKPGSVKVGTGGSAAEKRRLTTGSYFPPSKDHPIGLVGNIADQFAAEMQALLGSEAKSSGPEPAAATVTVKPEPKTLVEAPSPSSGHVLGRIEEHEVVPTPTPAPSSTNTTSAEQAPAPNTQPPAPSQQVASDNPPRPPQRAPPPLSGQPGTPMQNAQTRIPSAGQAVPPAPLRPQESRPPPGAPQQQWQGNLQQPMQRPPSVPPQMQMQPNRNKENKWTKWFKSSKPEKRPDAPQGGMLQQQHPPQQPQQWQPGPPIPGHPVQRLSMQEPPMQGSMPGYPVQGQPPQRQSILGQPAQVQPLNGQPLERPSLGGHVPPQTAPIKAYSPYQMPPGAAQGPIPQTIAQQGPPGSYPPQQFLPLQPGQPGQPGPPYGAPMQQMYGRPVMQMQLPGAPESPALSQIAPSQFSNSPSQASIASLPTGPLQPHAQIASPMQSNLMPAPLSLRPKSGAPVGVPASGQPS